MLDKKEIDRILENYFLEIHNRLNNFQRWQIDIENGLALLPAIKDDARQIKIEARKYLVDLKDIISNASYFKKIFKETQSGYRIYSNLIEKESKKLRSLRDKNKELFYALERMEARITRIEKRKK